MNELLLELFSEEIPARMQLQAAESLKQQVVDRLKKAEIKPGNYASYVTPRRITLVVDGLPEKQQDAIEELKGPRVGAPGPAIEGFLRSNGLMMEHLEERMTPKGEFYFAKIHKNGRAVADVLTEIIQDVIINFSWPKSMRWGDTTVRWVRPLRSILCLFAGEVLPVRFAHLQASNTTQGHRFHSQCVLKVKDFNDYKAQLAANKVVLDREERKQIITEQLEKQVAPLGLVVKQDIGLLEEVAGLVEWPVALLGSIDDRFMGLPPEVLSTSMRTHQRYFSVQTKDGKLAPYFLTVANIESDDNGVRIIEGNEWVLRARLEDAKFFWEQDQKHSLESRTEELKKIIFHAKLGNVYEKVERTQALSKFIAVWVPHANLVKVERAALLCKADLVSGMVGEFPELQGIMGAYYAVKSNENDDIANAIREHYSPLGPNDKCPKEPVSIAVALADKVDTLVGLFVIGEKPTGSKDPFALRRAALGVIRIIMENDLRIPLRLLLERALSLYPKAILKPEKLLGGEKAKVKARRTVDELLAFFAERLKVLLKDQSVRHDLINAVFNEGNEDDLLRLVNRVKTLDAFLHSDDGVNLLAAYKRATNIVRIEEKKDEASYAKSPDKGVLVQNEEKVLYEALESIKPGVEQALKEDDFAGAFALVASLRKPVDEFFEVVTVNCDNKEVRENRLMLLSQIRNFLDQVANFTLIEG